MRYKVGTISNIISYRWFDNSFGCGTLVEFTDGYKINCTIVWNTVKEYSGSNLVGRNFLDV